MAHGYAGKIEENAKLGTKVKLDFAVNINDVECMDQGSKRTLHFSFLYCYQ
jgi:hypothetical protein